MVERTDLLDTSPEMHQAQLRLLQSKSPEWKIQKTLELIDLSRTLFPEQTKRAIRESMKRK